MSVAMNYLRAVLSARLQLTEVRTASFESGWGEAPEQINSSRLIVIGEGTLPYTVGGVTVELNRGDAIMVPLRAWRAWTVPFESPVTLWWFRFVCDPEEPLLRTALVGRGDDLSLEQQAIERMAARHEHADLADAIALEGEAKAVLARVLAHSRPVTGPRTRERPRRGDKAVSLAVAYLNEHYAEDDALAVTLDEAQMSPSHFRKVFRAQVGLSPQAYLTRRRMQRARYLLLHEPRSVKDVAAQVGYRDPLYFSKQYRLFWGRSPSQDQTRRWS